MTDTRDAWRHCDIRRHTDALELPAVAVPHIMARKHDAQAARKDEVGDVTICAIGWGADEGDVGCGGEDETGVLGLADGLLVDQHHDFASVTWLARRRKG